jgi:uncharacterized RDD family membrane protein YckC
MFRLILILSLLPIGIALVARWWFGLRVLATEGKQTCRCDLAQRMPATNDVTVIHRAERSASEFGHELRLDALVQWRDADPKAAASREGARRFGKAVPPLSMMIAVFALLVGKVPFAGALAIVVAAIAVTAVLGLLSLPIELQAIAQAANRMRKQGSFPSRDDEETVIRCAIAHAWSDSPPAIFRWFQG